MRKLSPRFWFGKPVAKFVLCVLLFGRRPGYAPFFVNVPQPIRLALSGFSAVLFTPTPAQLNVAAPAPGRAISAVNASGMLLVGSPPSETVEGVGITSELATSARTPSYAPKMNVLFLIMGPPRLPPNWCCRTAFSGKGSPVLGSVPPALKKLRPSNHFFR